MTFDAWWEEYGQYLEDNHLELARASWHAALDNRWQPIETAPRDGRTVLVYFRGIGALTVQWEGDIWCVDDNKYGPYPVRRYKEGDDLLWMPRPELPKEVRDGG